MLRERAATMGRVWVALLLVAWTGWSAATQVDVTNGADTPVCLLRKCSIDPRQPECTQLVRWLSPSQNVTGCVLTLPPRDRFENLMLAGDVFEVFVPTPAIYFKKSFAWLCTEDNTDLLPYESFYVVAAERYHIDLVAIRDRDPSFQGADIIRQSFDLGSLSSPSMIRLSKGAGASWQSLDFRLEFRWWNIPLDIRVDTKAVFNWARFSGTFTWAKTVANSLWSMYLSKKEHNIVDSNRLQVPFATGSQEVCTTSIRFLDLGAGSGHFGIMVAAALKSLQLAHQRQLGDDRNESTLAQPCFHVVLSDVSSDASVMQQRNVIASGLQDVISVVTGDMFQGVVEQGWSNYFDAVFFYPPQIPDDDEASCSTCGPRVSLFVDDEAGDIFFRRFASEVTEVLLDITNRDLPPKRLWLGVDEEHREIASSIEGCELRHMYSDPNHASDLLEHQCLPSLRRQPPMGVPRWVV